MRRLTLLLPVVALVAVVAWLAIGALDARGELARARGALGPLQTALEERRLDDVRRLQSEVGQRTRAAAEAVDDPVWAAVSAVPLLGSNAAVIRTSALAADDVVREVLPPAIEAAEALDPEALRRPDGSVDLAVVAAGRPPLAVAAARATAVERRTGDRPRLLVVPPLGAAASDLHREVSALATALRGATSAADVAPALLGADRPRRWLVLVQQVSESRGTGGLVPAYAELEARDGRLRMTQLGSNADLRRGAVAPPDGVSEEFLQRYATLGALQWENTNVSPDLPVVARLFRAQWRVHAGHDVDGVITIDAQGLSHVLAGTPPIDVGGGQAVAPEDLVEYLAVGQYVGADDALLRKQRLLSVARAGLGRLTTGGGDTLALLRGLARAVAEDRIRMASDDPALRPVLARHGVDGAIPAGDAPLAYPVLFNTAGSKLDHWLHRSVRYEADDCDGRRRDSTVTVRLRSTPPEELPPYVTIVFDDDGVIGQSRTNEVAVVVYATRGATLRRAELDGEVLSADPGRSSVLLEPGQEAGLPLWQVVVDLPPNEERVLRLHLDEPTAAGEPRVPEQPLARPLAREVAVPTCS